jgi:ATP-dependent helicase HrpB
MLDVAQDNARRAALACDVAALLDERDPLPRGSAQGSDLSARVDALRRWRANSGKPYEADARVLARVERLAQQWRKHMKARMDNGTADAYEVGWLLAQAYPERVAQRRDADSGRYKLASGRGVQLLPADPLAHAPLIAVAHADAGQDDGKVYLAAPLDAQALEEQTQEREIATWDAREGVLVARRERRYGALTLSSKPTRDFPLEERSRLLREVVQAEGMLLFDWGDAARQLQARIESLRIWQGSAAGWPTVSDDALLADPDAWLQNAYAKVTRRADFGRINVVEALSALLSYALRSRLDTEAPTHRTVASGSHIRLTYAADGAPPVMAVKLQELFGEADTPTVNNGRTRVLIHLLSPAQRPIQVTQDLRNFWNTTYPEVRKELRGRYNKHPWPEDPWNATPTARTVKRMRQ